MFGMSKKMLQLLRNTFKRIVCIPAIKRVSGPIIVKCAYWLGHDPLILVQSCHGIGNADERDSGEDWLLRTWLPAQMERLQLSQPVCFDVGANIGSYSTLLAEVSPDARIVSFEPNPSAFGVLQEKVSSLPQVRLEGVGLGEVPGKLTMWVPEGAAVSSHASLHSPVLTDLHGYDKVTGIEVPILTLDDYCRDHGIDRIDFLKIDTEGHELAVLKGAHRLLESGAIRIIQFEFNEMNVVSRVFLKDFFDLLPQYAFYRLLKSSLAPLSYSSREEIFRFQNLVACLK
jgi:FkbM family methyltransferase